MEITIVDISTRKEYQITARSDGENLSLCPVCSDERSAKGKRIKCLSYNGSKEVGHCNHCDAKFVKKKEFIKPEKVYNKPTWRPNTGLSEKVIKWFESRGIKEQTLLDFKITEGEEWMPQIAAKVNTIQFNYFKDDELVNIKYRDGAKNFKLVSGAELILYNINAVKESEQVIIVEGEIDALSFHQAGYRNVVSVPNGANPKHNNLIYLDNCIDIFPDNTEFIIATDNDTPGKKLRDELAIRFGIDKCFKVDFLDCKDANDLLVKYGVQGFINLMENKKEFPIEGIYTAEDINDEIDDYYENGLPKGCGIGVPDFDDLLRFHRGYITTITGIPGHGKSTVIDYISARLNILHGWKFAFYSPEMHPMQLHFSFFAEKLIGKPFYGHHKMNYEELAMAKEYFKDNFFFVKPETDVTIDNILLKIRTLVRRKGIAAFVIDAWNKLDHQYSVNETKYVSEQLDKLGLFCQMNNVHLFLIAHPTKMQKDKVNGKSTGKYEVPNLYSISGSANFFNKTSNGISVYRNFAEDNKATDLYVQKVKFKHWGMIGKTSWNWDKDSNRYFTGRPDMTNWLTQKVAPKDESIPEIIFKIEDGETAPF